MNYLYLNTINGANGVLSSDGIVEILRFAKLPATKVVDARERLITLRLGEYFRCGPIIIVGVQMTSVYC